MIFVFCCDAYRFMQCCILCIVALLCLQFNASLYLLSCCLRCLQLNALLYCCDGCTLIYYYIILMVFPQRVHVNPLLHYFHVIVAALASYCIIVSCLTFVCNATNLMHYCIIVICVCDAYKSMHYYVSASFLLQRLQVNAIFAKICSSVVTSYTFG